MLHLEIQEGKDSMKDKEYVGELKAQAACTKRIAKASAASQNDDEDNIGDVFIGDSWFPLLKVPLHLWSAALSLAE